MATRPTCTPATPVATAAAPVVPPTPPAKIGWFKGLLMIVGGAFLTVWLLAVAINSVPSSSTTARVQTQLAIRQLESTKTIPENTTLLSIKEGDRPWTMVYEDSPPLYNVVTSLELTKYSIEVNCENNLALDGAFENGSYQGTWKRDSNQGTFSLNYTGGSLSGRLFTQRGDSYPLRIYPMRTS